MDDIKKLERIRELAHEIDDLVMSFKGKEFAIANDLSGGFISLETAKKLHNKLNEDN